MHTMVFCNMLCQYKHSIQGDVSLECFSEIDSAFEQGLFLGLKPWNTCNGNILAGYKV